MQNEIDVNAADHLHIRATDARDRVRANGSLPRFVSLPTTTWRDYFKWENLTVAGREIKGFVVSPFLAGLITTAIGVLLAAVITIGVTVYWRISDRVDKQSEATSREMREQHDLMIRLDQKLTDKNERDNEYKSKQIDDSKLQAMQIQDLKDKLLVINAKRGR